MKTNTSEQKGPWSLMWRFDRLKPPKWRHPYLMALHVFLKLLPLIAVEILAIRTVKQFIEEYFEISEGYFCGELYFECLLIFLISCSLADFFITKNYLGPRMLGLHHGFRRDDKAGITYHFYAERDFLTRYSSLDRDSFFTFFVFSSLFWFIKSFIFNPIQMLYSPSWPFFFWLCYFFFGFSIVYGNLYLYVQTRYKQEWSMHTFASTWAYNFFVQIKYQEEDKEPNSFRNSFYTRNARY